MSDEPRRKTLDEIRQEIEQEFGPLPGPLEEATAPAPRETAPPPPRREMPRAPIVEKAPTPPRPEVRPAPKEEAAAPRERPDAPPPSRREMPRPPLREPVRERLVDRLVARPMPPGRDADEDIDIEIEGDSRRALRRRGYLIAGLIGCIVGQFFVFGFLTTRYWMSRTPDLTSSAARPTINGSPPAPAPTATQAEPSARAQIAESTPSAAPDTSGVSDKAPSDRAASDKPVSDKPASDKPVSDKPASDKPASKATSKTAAPPTATAPPAPTDSDEGPSLPPPGTQTAPASPSTPVQPTPPAAETPRLPSALRAASPPNLPPPSVDPGRRLSQQAPSTPSVSAARLRSTDWVAAQAQLRSALRDWLVSSGLGDESVASDAVVILDVDGRTARTHVPVRLGGSVVVREQRWERQANVWRIVEDRQTERPR